ncbi:MAG: hypothetical protein KDB22_28460 [Planctomycetales bacterium]|nr:hypothetical protein [Planctomycetales bacterium]MCB1467691.1 hypothetical protein [Rhizobiaceae bacterium]
MPDFVSDTQNPAEFESSVRHVARQLYRHAESTGAINLDGRERDEIIDTGTELIVVEATQSRKLEKTKYDLKKSIDLIKDLRSSNRFSEYNFRIMLVTAEDPTADQAGHVKSAKAGCPKEIISFTALFSRLFDARHYIRVRGDHSFGSVRNPANEADYKVPPSEYIATALSREDTGESIHASNLAARLESGGQYVIYGDYGSGKSMTLRDIYFKTRDRFVAGKILRCPIYLNLRDHIAQTQPDEALYRHAEKVGFPGSHSLISAWRAGFVVLFLDGFDELTPPQFASSVSNLRQARRFAVELVRRFIEQTPMGAPIIIAGRESYFDGRDEARAALGYNMSAQVFDLAGFTDQDIERFLNAKGTELPTWLPTRPLLLGYLANAGLLKRGDELLALSPSNGWDQLLQQVCSREVSQVWGVGFESNDLRLFIERLATRARTSRDGRGLQDSDLRGVFRKVFGRDTDEPANLLTCRLPGLGSVPGRPGAREFIDSDFADAAASGDLGRYIEAPFGHTSSLNNVSMALSELGREMAAAHVDDVAAKVSIALRQASQHAELATTSADLMSILIDYQVGYKGPPLNIQDANFETIFVDPDLDFSGITFARCIINTVELGRSGAAQDARNFVHFHDCIIGKIEGAVSENDVPAGVLIGSTSVENYAAFTATNDAVMRSALPNEVKVLLTVLRKLFLQSGSGRQYSALRRGLPASLTKYVDPIVTLIKAEAFAQDVYIDRRTILIPNRSRSADALAIINGPNTTTLPLIERVRSL